MENQFELENANCKSEKLNLLIYEKEGDDIQKMIAYWIQEHQQRNTNYSIFCGARELESLLCHFFQLICEQHQLYILTKLRVFLLYKQAVFNITQKLNQRVKNQNSILNIGWICVQENLMISCTVIVMQQTNEYIIQQIECHYVIQGIDRFYCGGEVRASSWLPKILPENIKLISSARLVNKAYEYYLSIGNPIIPMQMLNRLFQIIHLFVLQSCMFQNNCVQLNFSKSFTSSQQLWKNTYSQFWKCYQKQKFCTNDPIASSIFCVLSYVNKGISIDEMMASCSCTQEQLIKVYDFFKICFLEKNQVYSISIHTMRQAIQQIQFNKNLNEQFLQIIEHSPNSTRKLEELIQQQAKNKKFFKLKEIIINIEHFLILQNPYNNFELCQQWDMLEQNGYDLVMEYNKALENFQAIYQPSTEGLFFIMYKICIFLREFSNFEKYFSNWLLNRDRTPSYKNPLLRGQSIEFKEVGLDGDLSSLKMLSKQKPKQKPIDDYFPTLISIKNNRDSFINYYQFDPNILQEQIQTKQDFLREKLISISKGPNPYQYKRWLWVQFPWLALKQKNNFSKLMQFYGKDSTQYMSIQEEIYINPKAIRLVINAKSSKDKSIQKLPEIRHRYYSPNINKDEPVKRFNQALGKSIDRTPSPSTGRKILPESKKKVLYSQQLKNRLKELQKIKQNLYPQEAMNETYRLNDLTMTQGDELKKQMDNLQGVQNEMKRMQSVLKLCQFNQDQNEERVQQLFRHCKKSDSDE
ncbi:unnamed protein product [Paramecium octaurelia]|uniref:Uncharacterized protein n=1 Tax=Paramecium octaurelia TaxID=43137 RepID=A0A8S1YCL7_PAROT|nr:unnamed protein product [Paramecium octaurelia]